MRVVCIFPCSSCHPRLLGVFAPVFLLHCCDGVGDSLSEFYWNSTSTNGNIDDLIKFLNRMLSRVMCQYFCFAANSDALKQVAEVK